MAKGERFGGPHGLVVVDKDGGMTSHDVVARARRLYGTRKVGHAGTLDPMATGVLVLGVGYGTKLLTYLVGSDKTYQATVRLGQDTVTEDREGEVTAARGATVARVNPAALAAAVADLTGDIQQVPSSVSAIKVDGKRSYARVREGEDVNLPARPVTVSRFEVGPLREAVADDGTPVVDFDAVIDCSSGTYVRALARDVGQALGTGGHLVALRRTRVGPFSLEVARTLAALADATPADDTPAEEKAGTFSKPPLVPLAAAAAGMFPVRFLGEGEVRDLLHGKRIGVSGVAEPGSPIAGLGPDHALVALLTEQGTQCRSLIVFPPD